MPFSVFQTYWLVSSHGRKAPPALVRYLPVGCRFTFAQIAEDEYRYVPGPGTGGPCAVIKPAVPSGRKVTVKFAASVGEVEFSVRRLGRQRFAIKVLPVPGAGNHGGAHGIDD